MASVQGAFYGVHLPAARIEALIAAHIPKKYLVEVADAYGTKWWDYRRLTPGHSFFLFAHHYYKSLRSAAMHMRWHRAQRAHVGILGLNSVHWTVEQIWDRDSAHLSGLWNAMGAADAMGIPYDKFCALGNQAAIDMKWPRLPKASQLYSAKIGKAIISQWEELAKSRFMIAQHPMYALENYAGLDVQDAYQSWLIERLADRGDPVTAIATVVYRTPQLPEATAAARFPANAMKRAALLAA